MRDLSRTWSSFSSPVETVKVCEFVQFVEYSGGD